MSKKFERALNEVQDAVNFGDVQCLAQFAPVISSLNKQYQEHILNMVVGAMRVDFVRALEPVKWKISNWKYAAVHRAGQLGCVAIVQDMAGELDTLSLHYCLVGAASSHSRGQLETVKLLAPMVHAANRPIVPAIRAALFSIHHVGSKGLPYRMPEVVPVLTELFRYVRVDQAIKRLLADEGIGRTDKLLPDLVEFIQGNLSDPEFIKNQAAMKPARSGPWTIELANLSGECVNALAAIQAAGDALALEARLANEPEPASRRTSPRL